MSYSKQYVCHFCISLIVLDFEIFIRVVSCFESVVFSSFFRFHRFVCDCYLFSILCFEIDGHYFFSSCFWLASIRFVFSTPCWLLCMAQYGWTALMWAADQGHADCARLLLDAGADTETRDDVRLLFCAIFYFSWLL